MRKARSNTHPATATLTPRKELTNKINSTQMAAAAAAAVMGGKCDPPATIRHIPVSMSSRRGPWGQHRTENSERTVWEPFLKSLQKKERKNDVLRIAAAAEFKKTLWASVFWQSRTYTREEVWRHAVMLSASAACVYGLSVRVLWACVCVCAWCVDGGSATVFWQRCKQRKQLEFGIFKVSGNSFHSPRFCYMIKLNWLWMIWSKMMLNNYDANRIAVLSNTFMFR